jgi:hypothetical protein
MQIKKENKQDWDYRENFHYLWKDIRVMIKNKLGIRIS